MLTRINEISGVGSLGCLCPDKGDEFSFGNQTVILADNAVGKTTLTSVLKSYGRKDPSILSARSTLGGDNQPFVSLDCEGASIRFQKGAWREDAGINLSVAVFDQAFIDENVFAAEVTSDHLKNIHLIILGEAGATLNKDLESAKEAERVARREFKAYEGELEKRKTSTGRTDYLDLPKSITEEVVSAELTKRESSLKALQQKPVVDALETPASLNFALGDFKALREALTQTADSSHEAARRRVKQRIAESLCCHEKAEQFLQTGMQLRPEDGTCPFCSQSLGAVADLLADYGQYFNETFERQKKDVSERIARFKNWSPDNQLNQLKAAYSSSEAIREKWKAFVPDLPQLPALTATIEQALPQARTCHEECVDAFEKKLFSLDHKPNLTMLGQLEQLFADLKTKVDECNAVIAESAAAIQSFKQSLTNINRDAVQAEVKVWRATGDALQKDAEEWRGKYNTARLAEDKANERRTKLEKDLEAYCKTKYSSFKKGINKVLRDFGLRFSVYELEHKSSLQSSQISTNLTFSVNGVSISASKRQVASPCFTNTLSSSEKNALAFAFFITNLEQSGNLASTIVVLDDPLSSFDDNRREQTAVWITAVSQKCRQVVVLTHRKDLVGLLYGQPEFKGRFFALFTDGKGGARLEQYDVKEDQRHEHEKRVDQLKAFLAGESSNTETLPLCIRKVIEFLLRLKYCQHLEAERDLTALIKTLSGANVITGEIAESLQYLNKRTQTGCHAESGEDPVYDFRPEEWRTLVRKTLEVLDKL